MLKCQDEREKVKINMSLHVVYMRSEFMYLCVVYGLRGVVRLYTMYVYVCMCGV